MVKGLAINFKSYGETIPQLLKVVGFDKEIKKHERIILKPTISVEDGNESTRPEFVEEVLKYCMEHKNPGTEILIAEGCDGVDSIEEFGNKGYGKIAERYGVGLVDLNKAETEEVENDKFLRFDTIHYPQILLDSFVISLPLVRDDWETGFSGSLDGMLGAFPARHYKGFLSAKKNKIRKHDIKYSIHDIVACKMPDFAILDLSDKGKILAGNPLEMDKQVARVMGFEMDKVPHIKLVDESFSEEKDN